MTDFQIELHKIDGSNVEVIDVFDNVRITQSIDAAWDFHVTLPPTKANRDLVSKRYRKVIVKSNDIIQFEGYLIELSTDYGLSNADINLTGKSGQYVLQNAPVPKKKLFTSDKTFFDYTNWITEDYQPDVVSSVVGNNASTHYRLSGKKYKYKKSVKTYNEFDGKIVTGTKVQTFTGYKGGGTSSSWYKGYAKKLNNSKMAPTDRIWDVISRLGKQVGIHPFFGPDKSLSLTTPNYALDPSIYGEGIIINVNDLGFLKPETSTVNGVRYTGSQHDRHSEYFVYGQGKRAKNAKGSQLKPNKAVVKDPGLFFHDRKDTPPYLTEKFSLPELMKADFPIRNETYTRRLARTEMESRLLSGINYSVVLPGLFSPSGVPYFPDSMVSVNDSMNIIFTPMYIKSVEKRFSMQKAETELILMPPEIWLANTPDNDDDYQKYMADRCWW